MNLLLKIFLILFHQMIHLHYLFLCKLMLDIRIKMMHHQKYHLFLNYLLYLMFLLYLKIQMYLLIQMILLYLRNQMFLPILLNQTIQ